MLANFGFPQIKKKISMFIIYIHLKKKFDSAQCKPVQSHLFREYLTENLFLRETILTCLSGAQMDRFMKLKAEKSRDTPTLKQSL